jgi:hypothetical protein
VPVISRLNAKEATTMIEKGISRKSVQQKYVGCLTEAEEKRAPQLPTASSICPWVVFFAAEKDNYQKGCLVLSL